ncbi:hypothetical protein DQK91_16500 [Oceanidesulfovibrio marinus]|uniref:Uncharacterized protein n=1 Tax=Oceanidesulfovibrio marinus TaxID=370038 RepID=A0A6P1ZCZ0_9BACT|nr:hypothetical protein DQK91_16500 [Oceanidesulfovibrio marinus]
MRSLLLRLLSDKESISVRLIATLEDPVIPLPDILLDMAIEGGVDALEKLGVGDAFTVLGMVRERNAATLALIPTAFEKLEQALERSVTNPGLHDAVSACLKTPGSTKTN